MGFNVRYSAPSGIFAWIYPLLMIGIGLLALTAGVTNYLHEEQVFARAEQEKALLISYVPDPDPKTADFCPQYEFTTQAGQHVSYVGDDCLSRPDYSKVGTTETIYVDPAQPQVIETRGWFGSEGSGLILGVVGFLFFSAIGLLPAVISLIGRLVRLVRGTAATAPARWAGGGAGAASAGPASASAAYDPELAELERLEQEEADLKRQIQARKRSGQ